MYRFAKCAAGAIMFSIGILLLFPLSSQAEEQFPACKAATEKVDYGSWLKVSEKTRALIDSYRADWKNLCDPKGKNKSSLSEVILKAKQIEADFKLIFDAFDDAILNDSNFKPERLNDLEDLVSKTFPAFVPAFKGAYGEHEYFSPSAAAFRENRALGNSEDRSFFDSRIPLEGDFPPFVTKTWEYGGCDQFGEYDWTGMLKKVAQVKKQVKSPVYLKDASQFEEALFRELGASVNICTCKAKDAVLKDLIEVESYVKKEAGYGSQAPKVQQTIDGIQSGKIKVRSEMEGHCSGG